MKTPTGETPFNLTFETEVVILVEVGLTTFKATTFDESRNDEELKVNLDLLDELREKACTRMARYWNQVVGYYNSKVKARKFEEGDLVLRKVSQATKDPTQGKLGPNWEEPYRVKSYMREGSYHLTNMDGIDLPHPWNVEHLRKYY